VIHHLGKLSFYSNYLSPGDWRRAMFSWFFSIHGDLLRGMVSGFDEVLRFIDPDARQFWLPTPADCPSEALGFDVDGAPFSHAGARVTFEVLLASFGLENPALLRPGALVHRLDAAGVQPPQSTGIEEVLVGLREIVSDDDHLLTLAGGAFDGRLASFGRQDTRHD